MNSKHRGVTLLELLIALALSSLILMAVMEVSTNMIRQHMEGSAKGSVTGENLYGLMLMNRQLQDASSLAVPAAGTSDVLNGCENYSRQGGVVIDPSRGVKAFHYCMASIGGVPFLLRYARNGLCPMPAPACGSAGYEVIARGFYRYPPAGYAANKSNCTPGLSFFARADDFGGVELRYAVGDPCPTVRAPIPRTVLVRTSIKMNKPYNSPAD
ncbi:MAG: prepilin-type N-terminal cleavage/methylation domain-containing protein [Elusimicrobiota bacterium]|jgi:prepilin-type N-terminal cleavage/methylation domain-containing protein